MSAKMCVAVAMSGGVDSSVTAALLKHEHAEVFGLMMRLWSPDPDGRNRCCSPSDMAIARRVAAKLELPFYVIDAKETFHDQVVKPFIDGYAKGITPNPCVACNRTLRWGFLLNKARAMGATHLATGHYARLRKNEGKFTLLRGRDRSKDQSYVLSMLDQPQLSQTILPLGDLMKTEVRQIAHEFHLPVADRPDSQDLCFVPNGDYRAFLRSQIETPPAPGSIIDMHGTPIGRHTGLADYTIGQRKGIGIASSHALYVIRKDIAENTLRVGPKGALDRRRFISGPMNWISGEPPCSDLHLSVQVRYKAKQIGARLEHLPDGYVEVHTEESLPDITPGQAAVFYLDEICMGGGIIQP